MSRLLLTVAFVLVMCLLSPQHASAEVVDHPALILKERSASLILLWVTEMFTSGDVAGGRPGYGRSDMQGEFRFARENAKDPVEIEIFVSQTDNLNHVGNATVGACCNEAILAQGAIDGCASTDDVGKLIISKAAYRDYSIVRYVARLEAGQSAINYTLPKTVFNVTDRYSLSVASCNTKADEVAFTGQTIWMNPYGLLPGHLYGYLSLYRGLAIAYGILSGLWIMMAIYYRRSLINLQHYITFVFLMCLIESLACFFDHHAHNLTGRSSTPLFIICAQSRVVHQTISRVLVIVVALGYGLARPSLKAFHRRIIMFVCAYSITALTRDLVFHFDMSATAATSVPMVLLTLLLAMIETYFFVWVFFAVYETLLQLKARKQAMKYRLYKQFTIVMVFTCITMVGFTLYNVFTSSGAYQARHWDIRWLADVGFWQIIYITVLFAIAFLFRPSINAKRYEYTQIIGADGTTSGEHEDRQLDIIAHEAGDDNFDDVDVSLDGGAGQSDVDLEMYGGSASNSPGPSSPTAGDPGSSSSSSGSGRRAYPSSGAAGGEYRGGGGGRERDPRARSGPNLRPAMFVPTSGSSDSDASTVGVAVKGNRRDGYGGIAPS